MHATALATAEQRVDLRLRQHLELPRGPHARIHEPGQFNSCFQNGSPLAPETGLFAAYCAVSAAAVLVAPDPTDRQGRMSIGVLLLVSIQISTMSEFDRAMQPSVQSRP